VIRFAQVFRFDECLAHACSESYTNAQAGKHTVG
jgi:hypothetical protein